MPTSDPPPPATPPRARATFPPSRRLRHDREYQAVYAAKMRKSLAPFTAFSRPNAKGFHRLGLSIAKRVGTAPERNRVKRLLREAFRLSQRDLPMLSGTPPQGLDIVISAHAHKDQGLAMVRATLVTLVEQSVKAWEKRQGRTSPGESAGENA